MATHAVATGRAQGWNVDLWAGVDGSKVEWTLNINQSDAKCRAMMERPGVRGCFLSHWTLWNLCVSRNEPIGIFEHDIEFVKLPPQDLVFDDVLKLEGFLRKKPRPAGEWYEGARAYILKPQGARKLTEWVRNNGALPADVAIGVDVVDITLDHELRITPHALYGKTDKRENSFTWNLENMERI
jgi:GR25 family glycosyltransferase involved in LPS biosynthesis